MQTQVVTLDVLKPIGTTVDLSDSFNARVGDKMTPFQLFITEGGVAKDLKGMHPELEAEVGNGALRNGVAVMAAGAKGVHWVGSTNNVTGYNQLTLAFPAEVFPQSGFCYGHLILANDAGVRETSVDIWFQVLDGTPLMGLVADHYDSELQLELAKAKNANDQFSQEMRDTYNQQVTDAQNALARATANLTDLATTAGNISAQIKANDIITRADFKQLDDRVAARLAQIKLSPAAFANLDDLKAKYPNGNDNLNVTVDNGHLIIWFNGEWKDCGQYQTAGLEVEVLKPLKQAIATLFNKVSQHESRLSTHDYVLNNHEQRLDDNNTRIKNNQTKIENLEGVGSLKDIELTDQDGNHLTDNFGVHIGDRRWLINTDKTLTQADLPADAKAVGEALVTKPENYDIPILYLYGAGIEGMQSKKDSVSVGLSYKFPRFNLSGVLNKIKVQGSSSASLPKKNYTLQFDQAVELINGYGKQKKYVIKADMTDFSHARNVGCAELWGKVRQTRIKADNSIKTNDTDYLVDNAGNHIVAETDPQLSIGGTYGSVDGFPIAVYINDKYWGLYTFNIPKDKGMAKMSKSKGHAIVSTVWASFNETTRLNGKDMDIEFCGTEESDWVFRSINALIDIVKASYDTKDDFTKVITPLLDIDSAIDYYVYSVAIGNVDGIVRNFNLQTWNGKKWYFAAYDLDMVFGRTPDLLDYLSPEYNGSSIRHGGLTFENMATGNRIFHQLWKFYKDEIIARYKDLASNVLSSANVGTFFTNYVKKIPVALKAQEDKTWPQTPLTESNNIDQIRWWYMYHINFLNRLVANA
ncbi:CotH kinase family protein [Limosilactobacillus reuteri]|uniref:CotH kinase family protein n=1 Tax=Limosilactobacillus reuteri TaxID=1598 RepID=UPI00254C2C9A|nr:CotH kinase family protein [Limosilactobacillus reuteri]MDK8115886.1 CotH kinase family protein [Limosilactobacillus reuteri]